MKMHAQHSDGKEQALGVGVRANLESQHETSQSPRNGRAVLPELDPAETALDSMGEVTRTAETWPRYCLARLATHLPNRQWIPNRKVTVFLALAGVAWWRPWLIPGVIFLSIWIVLIVYLTIGPDRLAELLAPLTRRFATRFPDRAEALRKSAQAGSNRFARLVEKLPMRWRDSIEVPQFGAKSQIDAGLEDRPDPFDRLAAERERDLGHV